MRETLAEWRVVFAEELRRVVRRWTFVLLVASVPALMALALGATLVVREIADRPDDASDELLGVIGVVDLSPDVDVAGLPVPVVRVFATREEGMRAFVVDETVGQLFVVSEDYLETGRVEWVWRPGDEGNGSGPDGASEAVLTSVLRAALAGGRLAPGVLRRANAPAGFERVRVGGDLEVVEDDEGLMAGRFIVAFLGAFVLLFSIMIGSSTLVTAVAEEKENRMIETLLTSVRPFALLAGKLLAVGAANLAMVAVWLASIVVAGPLIFSALPAAQDVLPLDTGVLVWVLAFFLGGYLVSAVVMAGIGAVATGVREATQLSAVVIVPLIVPIYAFLLILQQPDGTLSRVLSFVPFTAPTTMMMRLAAGQPAPLEMGASLLVMLLAALGLLWVSARAFATGLLHAGGGGGVRRLVLLVRRPA